MCKLMKIKDLKNYGIPSYIVNIWEKHYSPYLLPLQEDAIRNYGILNCGEKKEGRMQYAPTEKIDSRLLGNDIRGNGNDPSEVRLHGAGNNNLLVIAPTSSGKSFIGEMAALSRVIHQKKIIYLVPSKYPAEEKYRHFKNLYNSYGLETVISTRNHREEDYRIIRGSYKIAVIAYEKFNYFLLKYPNFLDDVSLVIIDEMQMINNPKWGPLLEDIIEHLLAHQPEQVMSYDELLNKFWKDEEDAIYNRVSFHFSKIRSTILKTIVKSKRNKERVKDIFKVISRRGIMLNLAEEKLKIS